MNQRFLLFMAGFFPACVFATAEVNHGDPAASIIFWVTSIFFFGVIGRYIAKKLKLPGVLGELLMGIVIGNLCYFLGLQLAIVLREGPAIFNILTSVVSGVPLSQATHLYIPNIHYATQVTNVLSGEQGADLLKIAFIVDTFSRYGVIFLLFMVGLESSVVELRHTGRASLQVAIIGVAAPILLGLLVTALLMPQASLSADLFIAATLSATSIGITARVLKDMHKLQTREAKTILGAAMIDDVLGLVILAIVSSIVIRGVIDFKVVGRVIGFASIFFMGALFVGPWILRKTILFFKSFFVWEAKLFTAFLFLMGMAWLATLAQLATIIGAFVAGVIIHDGFFDKNSDTLSIQTLVAPFEAILAPIFFMLIGIQVKIETFFDWHVLLIASGLIFAAVLGKLVSGLGASAKDDRLLIGIGMLPRGEVGLVFASIGRTIGVISDDLFSAIILMVIVTTLIAPPWLKLRYAKQVGLTH